MKLITMALLVVGLVACGCNKSETSAVGIPVRDSATAEKPESLTTVRVQKDLGADSPARLAPVEFSADLQPQEVCAKFLTLLTSGDISDAERLLSKRSASVTRQARLTLSAPASASSRFKFDTPQYANNKQQLAMVVCRISDGDETGSAVEPEGDAEISWMLRKETEGWRITGLVLLDEGLPSDLLSFENPADVEKIRDLLGDDAPVRQAAVPGEVSR